jgi:hypothetical protein
MTSLLILDADCPTVFLNGADTPVFTATKRSPGEAECREALAPCPASKSVNECFVRRFRES